MKEESKKDWVRKSISIEKRHERFIRETSLGLSSFVKSKLDNYMKRHPDWDCEKQEVNDQQD